jgi:DNA-binding GntR family transcriptional regulator
MTQLAKEINDSRLDVSRALNRLEMQGWLTLSRGHIDIPSIESAFDL